MVQNTPSKTPQTQLAQAFFAPLEAAYLHSLKPHDCPVISDLDHARLCIHRCLSESTSGHGFLQYHADQGGALITPDHFFKSLSSPRRAANLASINHNLRAIMATHIPDPFLAYPELEKYHIYAGDGHYHHAAAFDPKPNKKQHPDTTEKTQPTGHFFRLDLRSHHIGHLDMSTPKDGKKSEHDITLIKRLAIQQLRNTAPKGHKVIYAWDRACIDYHLWDKLKRQSGIYFITLQKENSNLKECTVNRIDPSDECNQGIVSDHYCTSASTGQMLRRIVYIDPRDGTTYRYLTSEMQLPAHLIVIIYKQRWDIEKTFHQFKSKLFERKSWSSSTSGKASQAHAECLTHNLMLLMEWKIRNNHGIEDQQEQRKSQGRQKTKVNRGGYLMKQISNHINQAIQRASQRTLKFIRWLRNHIYQPLDWSHLIARLTQMWMIKSP